jgi:hypothetical protein
LLVCSKISVRMTKLTNAAQPNGGNEGVVRMSPTAARSFFAGQLAMAAVGICIAVPAHADLILPAPDYNATAGANTVFNGGEGQKDASYTTFDALSGAHLESVSTIFAPPGTIPMQPGLPVPLTGPSLITFGISNLPGFTASTSASLSYYFEAEGAGSGPIPVTLDYNLSGAASAYPFPVPDPTQHGVTTIVAGISVIGAIGNTSGTVFNSQFQLETEADFNTDGTTTAGLSDCSVGTSLTNLYTRLFKNNTTTYSCDGNSGYAQVGSQELQIVPNTVYRIDMDAGALAFQQSGGAIADPYLSIDPSVTGYNLVFSPGIINAPAISPVPEPSGLIPLLVGFAAMGAFLMRRMPSVT